MSHTHFLELKSCGVHLEHARLTGDKGGDSFLKMEKISPHSVPYSDPYLTGIIRSEDIESSELQSPEVVAAAVVRYMAKLRDEGACVWGSTQHISVLWPDRQRERDRGRRLCLDSSWGFSLRFLPVSLPSAHNFSSRPSPGGNSIFRTGGRVEMGFLSRGGGGGAKVRSQTVANETTPPIIRLGIYTLGGRYRGNGSMRQGASGRKVRKTPICS